MTNAEAINILIEIKEEIEFEHDSFEQDSKVYIEKVSEAVNKAIAALCFTDEIKIEVIEHHTFAKPEEVNNIDFPNTSSENK